ncbi:MAG: RNA polymerase sigma factor [Bacteroidetes bacterium]|nr:RNA polymerase sigma factor [Bacteroidota bacterium]
MELPDDRIIIKHVLAGDTAAYAHLVEKHKDMAYSMALKITRNREDAEEIAQDAFVKAFHSLRSFRQESRFSTWLFRIVYNTAISRMRKRKTETITLDDDIVENFTTDEIHEDIRALSDDEQRILLNNALEKLPVIDYTIITLFYIEDCPVEEISQITGLTNVNVKVRLHRIRKRLYAELNESFKRILN